MDEHAKTTNGGQTKTSSRRRRRWPYVLTAVIVLLAIPVLLLPSLVSTNRGTNVLLRYLNSRLRGNVQVRNVSLTWKGPTDIQGVEVKDPEGRKVLAAKRITWARGVWGAVTSAMHFDNIKIDSPQAVLYFDDNGEPSIARAVETQGLPSPSTQPAALPKPVGRLTIRGANVVMVQPSGRRYEISSLDGQFDLNTLSNVKGTINVKLPEGSQVNSTFDVRKLATEQDLSLQRAEGTVHLTTSGAVDLQPLAVFALDNPNVAGKLTLQLDADFQSGRTKADFAAKVAGLKAGRTAKDTIRPIDLDAVGELRASAEKLTAQATIGGQPGKVAVNLAYKPSKQGVSLSQEDLLGLILRGERHPLPEFTLTSDGSVDIPTLARAVPALLTLRPGVEITSGQFLVDHVRIEGGDQPSVAGTVQLTQVTATRGNQSIALPPVISGFDLLIKEGRGLVIRKANLDSVFLEIRTSGILSNLDATFSGDLAKINRFGEVFHLFSVDAAGTVSGRLNLRQPQSDRLDIALDMTTQGFRYANDQGRLDIGQASVNYSGYMQIENRKLRRLAANEIRARIDDRVQTTGSGWYDLDRDCLHAEVAVNQSDLGYIADRMAGLGGNPSGGIDGTLWTMANVDRNSGDDPLRISGNGRIERFRSGSGPDAYADNLIRFSADRVLVSPQRGTVSVGDLALSSSPLTLRANGNVDQYDTRRIVDFQGTYNASWDQITTILHQMVPATVPIVSIMGRGSSHFRMAGPTTGTITKGLNASWGMNWPSGVLCGLTLGQTSLSPAFRNGRLFLPTEPIPASNGLLFLGGFIDFMPRQPIFRLPGQLTVLNEIRIDPTIGRELLSRINPIFSHTAQLDGRASLTLSNLTLPLSDAIKTSSTGGGHLDLRNVHIPPPGVLGELMKLGMTVGPKLYPIQFKGVDFTIGNGRINYDNFRVDFLLGYDMIFFGSVGFDDTVSMFVSLPLKPAILEQFDFRPEFLRPGDLLVRNIRIVLPLAGTRQNLMVDLSRENVHRAIRESLKGIIDAPRKDLQGLFRPFTHGQKQNSTTQPSPLLDVGKGILDLLKGNQ